MDRPRPCLCYNPAMWCGHPPHHCFLCYGFLPWHRAGSTKGHCQQNGTAVPSLISRVLEDDGLSGPSTTLIPVFPSLWTPLSPLLPLYELVLPSVSIWSGSVSTHLSHTSSLHALHPQSMQILAADTESSTVLE